MKLTAELLASSDGKTYLDMKEEHFSLHGRRRYLVKNEGSAPAAKIWPAVRFLGIA